MTLRHTHRCISVTKYTDTKGLTNDMLSGGVTRGHERRFVFVVEPHNNFELICKISREATGFGNSITTSIYCNICPNRTTKLKMNGFLLNLYWALLIKFVDQIKVYLKSDKNNVRIFRLISCCLRASTGNIPEQKDRRRVWRNKHRKVSHSCDLHAG